MNEFRKYKDNGEDLEFSVFIIHGHSDDWRNIERHINRNLNFRTIVLKEDYSPGVTLIEKVEEAIEEECDCAVVLLTPDDTLQNGKFHSRPNTLFELGYAYGSFGRDCVIILKENSVDLHSDIAGMDYIPYDKGKVETTLLQLSNSLEEIYADYVNGRVEDY